jgi:alpha-L-fucosidase 2
MISMTNKLLVVLVAALFTCLHAMALGPGNDSDLTLWYQQPAADKKPMDEALPIGNGRMGALIFGAPERERIVVSESSLWTGGENPSGDYDTMGAYQVLGNVYVNLPGHANVTQYRRDLNIGDAVSSVSYQMGEKQFHRQFFCSHPAQVLEADFQEAGKGGYTGSVELEDSHQGRITVDGNRITASGRLDNGMKYEWQVLVLRQRGTVGVSSDTNATRLEFSNCDSLTLLIGARTDYTFDYTKDFHGDNPHPRVTADIDAAEKIRVARMLAGHIQDYHSLFNRVGANFGESTDAQRALPTDQRKLRAFETVDPGLDALQFQYGRYLLISCSRPGGLPANLQGLWNDQNNPPWHSDYHANINVQMNYWPAEVANLGDCHTPFFDLIASQLPAWRKATAAAPEFKTADGEFARRGFAIRTSHNITGGMGWKWDKTANAWYCQHLWEHYAFGLDKNYLRSTAYPIIKETCEFWEDHLKALPDGKLVVPNGWSPEHGPDEDGVSYNQEIVWDLFNNYVQAADALGVDKEYRDKIAGMRDRLVTPGVGSWGQLLEWMHEQHNPKYPELDTPNDHHRHSSHLFAVYPGSQISVAKTPALAAAAKVSLDARGIDPGSDVREWSFAWRTALYARLRDPENAYDMLRHFFAARNSSPNLFGLHPPVQLDGDFGITAGIAEMLLQSQAGEIELLPALPKEWPAGSISGLRARGGCEVSLNWKDGKLTSATIKNISGNGRCAVRYGEKTVDLNLKQGATKVLDGELQ